MGEARMADLRIPAMADVSYDRGERQTERASEFAHHHAIARALKFERQKATLLRTVEVDIVPRLFSAHQPPATEHPLPDGSPCTDDGVKMLAGFALGRSQEACSRHVQELLEQGTPLEKIYLDTLVPTASHLRQLWIDDECDFAKVTLGLWRLQQLIREFSTVFRQDSKKPTGRRALLTLMPGETHELPHLMFTVVLTGEFLRLTGWNTWIEPDCRRRDAMALFRSEWFDVVEFLVNSDNRLEILAAQIKAIRAESINPSICIAIAGEAVQRHPELLKFVGADVLVAGLKRSGSAYPL